MIGAISPNRVWLLLGTPLATLRRLTAYAQREPHDTHSLPNIQLESSPDPLSRAPGDFVQSLHRDCYNSGCMPLVHYTHNFEAELP